MKYGNLNFLEPSGPLQACNGTDLPFYCLLNTAMCRLPEEMRNGNKETVKKRTVLQALRFCTGRTAHRGVEL